MDITETLAPKSDQLDAVDLLGGPRTFTIESVSKGNAEQPVNVKLAEFPRVWRPGKSMRRVLAAAWGRHADEWAGKRLTLFCDPTVKFGGEEVGGTRISHMSHIDGVKKIPLIVARGKSATYTVQPLTEAPAPAADITADEVAACADLASLKALWDRSNKSDAASALIGARKAELEATNQPELPMDGEQ